MIKFQIFTGKTVPHSVVDHSSFGGPDPGAWWSRAILYTPSKVRSRRQDITALLAVGKPSLAVTCRDLHCNWPIFIYFALGTT